MRPTDKPYIIAGEPLKNLVKKLVRCVHCSTPTDSRYLLKGEKTICHGCIKTYGLIEVSDRDHQVLKLLAEGLSNPEIREILAVTDPALHNLFQKLKKKGLIQGAGIYRARWTDPRSGREHWVTRREAQILEIAFSPELRFDYRYVQTIVEKTNLSSRTIKGILEGLHRRGIHVPNRDERVQQCHSRLKQGVFIEGKPTKVIAKQTKRSHSGVRNAFSRMGLKIRGESLPQKVYRYLLQGGCSRDELYQEFKRQGFSTHGIANALYTLKRLNLVSRRGKTFSVIKQVDPSQIKTRHKKSLVHAEKDIDPCQIKCPNQSRKKTPPMPPSGTIANPSSSESSTMQPVAAKASPPSRVS